MTTSREEPAAIEETGVGWPGAPPPKPARPPGPSPEPPKPPPPALTPSPPAPRQVPPQPRRTFKQQLPPERPGTVTAAAVILFVGAGLALLACCGLNLLASNADVATEEPDLQRALLLVSAILVVSGGLNVLFGYFLLQGRQWARVATIVLCAVGIVLQAVGLFTGTQEGSTMAGTCLGVLLNVIIIGLLSGSSASEYFRAVPAWR